MLEVLDRVASTNDVARERALDGAAHGYAVRANEQTSGRGQRGHGWASPAGGLYLSIVLRPAVPQRVMGGLPAACALGAARALDALGARDVRIKWPNDLVAGDAKLGGLLTEAGWSDAGVYAVCGIGVNVEVPLVPNPSPHAMPATGLDACLPPDAPVPFLDDLAGAVRDGVVETVDAWAAAVSSAGAAAMPLTGIMDLFYDRLAYMGEYVALFDREGRPYAAGTFTGIDAWGRALVRVDEGRGAGSDAAGAGAAGAIAAGAGAAEQPFDPAQVSIRPLR